MDFDGTITTKDTLFQFLKFLAGSRIYYFNLFLLAPYFIGYFIALTNPQKLKEKILLLFLKSKKETELKKIVENFISFLIKERIIKPDYLVLINEYKKKGATVAVVSASPDLWIDSFCKQFEIIPICTKLEFSNGYFTGKFITPNCNGEEKVVRIKQAFNLKNFSYITAYGNSAGDLEMLNIANEKNWVKKNKSSNNN